MEENQTLTKQRNEWQTELETNSIKIPEEVYYGGLLLILKDTKEDFEDAYRYYKELWKKMVTSGDVIPKDLWLDEYIPEACTCGRLWSHMHESIYGKSGGLIVLCMSIRWFRVLT